MRTSFRFLLGAGLLAACLLAVVSPGAALAGMPMPHVSRTAQPRLENISFFLFGLLVSAVVIRLLWNSLRGDFPRLPRLSWWGGMAVVVLWGMLFLLVLTMIAGARELLTPGAWEREETGLLYKLADDSPVKAPESPAPRTDVRRDALQLLRTDLWDYAAEHDGRFPLDRDTADIEAGRWVVPGAWGVWYVYVSGRETGDSDSILAYEPEVFDDGRLALRVDGRIATMSSAEIRRALEREEVPR